MTPKIEINLLDANKLNDSIGLLISIGSFLLEKNT